jgi:hypothetical protein
MSASAAGLKLSRPTYTSRHPLADRRSSIASSRSTLKVMQLAQRTSSGASASHSSRSHDRLPPMLLSMNPTMRRCHHALLPRSMRCPARMSRTTRAVARVWKRVPSPVRVQNSQANGQPRVASKASGTSWPSAARSKRGVGTASGS